MKLAEIIDKLSLRVETSAGLVDTREVTGGYVSDLLSDVMAKAKAGNLWVTSQTHQNIVAVASLLDLSGIVLVGGLVPDDDTLKKAESNGVVLLTTNMTAFELVGRMYELGVGSGSD